MKPKKIVLAYSGGLDTSVIVPWLKENYDCEVVAFVGDVGQGADELEGVEEKAIKSGASSCHIVDLKREFVEQYVYPTMLAGAVYEGRYLLGTSMARPVLAKAQAELALKLGADALSHGCTGKGNDQVRFESAFAAIAPHLQVIAPWREWKLRSREQLIAYLADRNIPCSTSLKKIYSRDKNLWHISHEGGALEDLWNAPPDDIWTMTSSVAAAPNEPANVRIEFKRGRPVSLNGETLPGEKLIAKLNTIAGAHAVGRIDLIENRLVGMKSRGCYETPGGTVLYEALRGLEEVVLDRETLHYRQGIALKFAELVYDGRWFTPLREALSACVDKIGERLDGEVVVRLHKGQAVTVQRRSPNSLYSDKFATFGQEDVYNQSHAEGFIRLFSLPLAHRGAEEGRSKRLMALWGGRFEGKTDPLFRALNDSLRFDWRLVKHDIAGSIAWAWQLVGAGVLSMGEAEKLAAALGDVARLAEGIGPAAPADCADEDVHSWVEARLIERVGDLGKKLHTGRSRNDQVATDLRLWTREQIELRIAEIRAAQQALVSLAEREAQTPLPGYTHLQRAQPVLFAHWCLAYFEMLARDASRFENAARRANESPLGSGALAGTAYPIDRAALAASLDFDRPTANSLDAVSDRDFVVEALAAASLCAVHLSRLAEDLIIYSSAEFGFVELADAVTSGSSLMPQKKNPDALELLRGKCGRIVGAQVALLMTLKGLPLAYNKDLQEDKEPLFDAMEALSLCLRVVPVALEGMTVQRDVCLAAAAGGYSNATDLADYLVAKGVPFRDAHDAVGKAVRHAIEKRCALEALPLDDLRRFAAQIEPDVFGHLSIEAGMRRRAVIGATAPQRVAEAIADAKRRLATAS